ncbi:hypothetical protein D9M71_776890 [compost metagenome]
MHKAQGLVTSLERQDKRQQACGIARVFQRPVLLAGELHSRQLQGAVEPQRSFQAPGLGKALLEIHVRHLAQSAIECQALPILE